MPSVRSMMAMAEAKYSQCPARASKRKCARGSRDRKSTRLNSSHGYISYAVFCLKKKKNHSSSRDVYSSSSTANAPENRSTEHLRQEHTNTATLDACSSTVFNHRVRGPLHECHTG